jgi:hypothetical protein
MNRCSSSVLVEGILLSVLMAVRSPAATAAPKGVVDTWRPPEGIDAAPPASWGVLP